MHANPLVGARKAVAPFGGDCFAHFMERIRILFAQAGGLCMNQCSHW